MSDYTWKKTNYINMHYYDRIAWFVTDLDFCCEDPYDYITDNGEYPEYFESFKTEQDAIDYFLEDRGFHHLIANNKRLDFQQKEIDKLKEEIKYKDLDIEMYMGRIGQIRNLLDCPLSSWQEIVKAKSF